MASSRHCTDILCILIFGIAIGGLSVILNYAVENGDYRRLFHGYNYQGQLCGVDVPEKYLFYCLDRSNIGALDLSHPICVHECPSSDMAFVSCPSGLTLGYETRDVAGRYCMPKNKGMLQDVSAKVASSDFYVYAEKVSQLPRAWASLIVSGAVAFALGYLFLLILEMCAGTLVWLGLLLIIVCPSIVGSYLIWVSAFEGGFDGIPDSGNDEYNFYIGCACSALGLLFGLFVCCSRHSITTAVECVRIACECLSATPSLLLSPLIELSSKLVAISALIAGLCLLISCGTFSSEGGIYRNVTYSNTQRAYLAYYVFMILWISELFTSFSQFVIAHTTQRWYFAPKENGRKRALPPFSILQGYCVGITFHLGSLIFGSLLIAAFRFARIILGYIAKKSKASGNDVGSCIAKILMCIVACFQRVVEFVNKNAYIEIAINSNSFCVSAQTAIATLAQELGAVGLLHGATGMLQLAGIGSISCAGAAITWYLCHYTHTFGDMNSKHYVSDPIFMAVVAASISAIIAWAFMVVFDTVTDTILYCFATDMKHGAAQESPPGFKARGIGSGDARDENVTSWLFGCVMPAAVESDEEEKRPKYPEHAPAELRRLLEDHQ